MSAPKIIYIVFFVLSLFAGSTCYSVVTMPHPPQAAFPVNVELLEDHQESLAVWIKHGIRGATVVHVDAHHDLLSTRTASEWKPLRIAVQEGQSDRVAMLGDELASDHLYDLSSYLVPAWDLGIVAEVWWVYPHHAPFDSDFLKQLKNYLKYQQSGIFQVEEITAWHQDGKYFRGTLRGIPVTVTRLEDLPNFEQPVLLDVDCDYFVGDAGFQSAFDMARLTMKERLQRFFTALESKRMKFQSVTIAHSVAGDYLPLRYRYIGHFLMEQFADSRTVDNFRDQTLAEFWQAEAEFEKGDFDAAFVWFNKLFAQKNWLTDSAAYYLALIAALQGDEPLAAKQIMALVARNQDYTWGLFDIGTIARRNHNYDVAMEVFRWAVSRGGRWEYEGHMETGRVLVETGNYREAEREFRLARSIYPHMAPATVLLAHSLMDLYRFGEAFVLYRVVWANTELHYEYRDRAFLPNFVRSALVVGDYTMAREALLRLQQVDPENPALNGLVLMYRQSAEYMP